MKRIPLLIGLSLTLLCLSACTYNVTKVHPDVKPEEQEYIPRPKSKWLHRNVKTADMPNARVDAEQKCLESSVVWHIKHKI